MACDGRDNFGAFLTCLRQVSALKENVSEQWYLYVFVDLQRSNCKIAKKDSNRVNISVHNLMTRIKKMILQYHCTGWLLNGKLCFRVCDPAINRNRFRQFSTYFPKFPKLL